MTFRQVVSGRLPVFVAGTYCVLVGVVPVGFAPAAPAVARAATWLCLLSLLVSLQERRRLVALWAGTAGVLGGALFVFGAALWAKQRVPALPLAVLGFFALSLAWGALSSPVAHPGASHGTPAAWLRPRRSAPGWQVTLGNLVLLALPLLLLPPLTIASPAKATFAVVLALCLVLLLARECTDLLTRAWLREAAPSLKPARALRRLAEVTMAILALSALLTLPDV